MIEEIGEEYRTGSMGDTGFLPVAFALRMAGMVTLLEFPAGLHATDTDEVQEWRDSL